HCALLSCRCMFAAAPATSAISTLSLHDALPISAPIRETRHERQRSRINAARDNRRANRRGDGAQIRSRKHLPHPTRLVEMGGVRDRKSTRLNSSHVSISYAVFCLKKKITKKNE